MVYGKVTKNGIILAVGKNIAGDPITEDEYNEIMSVISNHPEETETIGYRLKADLTWEEYEKSPEPEEDPTPEEALTFLLGGDA